LEEKKKVQKKKFSLHIDVNCVCYFILKFKFDEVKSKKWTMKNKEDKKTKIILGKLAACIANK